MSGQGSTIFATFIDRINSVEYAVSPKVTRLTYSTDMRQFTDAFDFVVEFGPGEYPGIRSHDFVEFWYRLDGLKYQVGVGYIEDLVDYTRSGGARLEGNGRNLFGQLISIPFKKQVHRENIKLPDFLADSLKDTYVKEYLSFRGRPLNVISVGAYSGGMLFKSDLMAKRGAVIEEYADLAINLVYMDRLGRPVIYGRDGKDAGSVGKAISSVSDPNVTELSRRQNFSKVLSEVSVIFQGEQNLDVSQVAVNKQETRQFKNTDSRISHIYQPDYRFFSAPDLVGLAGQDAGVRSETVCKSVIRKSNQNLSMIVVSTECLFHVDKASNKTPYEVGQKWQVRCPIRKIDAEMKLAGIHCEQENEQQHVQLGFVEDDTLV